MCQSSDPRDSDAPGPRFFLPLFVLFGSLYFVQGVIEPTACLPAQPIQSQLRSWGHSAESIGRFFGVIAIAWSLKPLFGLLSDFLPISGYRRRPYLILATAATALAFFGVAAFWGPGADVARIGWLLAIAGFGIALTDVVIDALAVETGQPLGITGQIQSVQWLALSFAGLLVGVGGGYVSQHHLQQLMFAACGTLALVSLAVVIALAREPRHAVLPRDGMRQAWSQIWSGRRLVVLLSAAAFLFAWNFNPFSSNVLQTYMTAELGLDEQFYGNTRALQAVGSIAACLAYGGYCRRVPFGRLIHLAIIAGIASSLGFLVLRDRATAIVASLVWGFAWQTGLLVQLDLSARVCPTESAGTLFALLMAISNTGESLAIYLGGGWYDRLALHFGGNHQLAFQTLVIVAAACTASCWLVVPLMKWAGVPWK